ncbi:hypothetical protein HDU77_001907 [Chytriomyces hyalinus]|nr:hypothetical protein HDU77_001907 [Chytriomyces hyalinus]
MDANTAAPAAPAPAALRSATPEQTTDEQGEMLSGRKYCKHPGCSKHFSTTAHLSRHLLVHSGVRKYKCDYPGCHGAFFRADGLTQHKKTHTKTTAAKEGLAADPYAAIHYSSPSVFLVPHMAVTSPVSPNSMPREIPLHHMAQHHIAMSPTPPSERPVVMTSRLSSSQGYFHHHHTINGGVTKRNHTSPAVASMRHMSQPTHVASQQYRGGPWILTPVAASHGLPQQYSQHIPVSSSHIPSYRAHPSQQQHQQPYGLDQDVYLQPVYADGRPVSSDVYFVNVNSAGAPPKMLPSVSVASQQHQGYTVSAPHSSSYSVSPHAQSYSVPPHGQSYSVSAPPPHHRYSVSAQHESSAPPYQNYSTSAPHQSFSGPHQNHPSSSAPQQSYSVAVPTQNIYHTARHQEQSFSASPVEHDAPLQPLAPISAQAPTREASPNKTALSFLVD